MAPENLIANHECWHAENSTCDCPVRILPQLLLYRRVMEYVLRIGDVEMARELCDRSGICHIATVQEYGIKRRSLPPDDCSRLQRSVAVPAAD